jgi:hypothetical protein
LQGFKGTANLDDERIAYVLNPDEAISMSLHEDAA